MILLPIIKYPNSILNTPCSAVLNFDEQLKNLIDNMTYTMLLNKGVGLAANQISVSQRVIVFINNGKFDYLINPSIINHSGLISFKEGCLSFPGLNLSVNRFDKISVLGYYLSGKQRKLKAEGILSVILQHEIDHLNGILFNLKGTI